MMAKPMQFIDWLFGEGSELAAWQMGARALVVFFLALAMIRASGRRSFGQQSPFDTCITVLLGAVLSRAVVGASPFWSTMAAGVALVVTHRLVALASMRWQGFEDLINGHEITLVRDGRMDYDAMRHALVSRKDLDEALRQQAGGVRLDEVERAVLERDGKLSIVRRRS
ncbi:uncharacterized membrane protein YcaP (DUF421 family) [Variovorax sp. SG517]|uniref:DUF421 domain-containing protein n=1 Tax=Variovorax sp. SG517 TaxID=2587117 RepID=UPI00183B9440|nr:YetF domain-containing protein [Variovorax sp. SG517]NVM90562.1 uncharacterized membrane protein YcaP (DUF421 family) [Variovorax sp. SG517]